MLALAVLVAFAGAPAAQGFQDLDPSTYVSPSGEYALFVDPSARTGAGEGRYRFTRKGEELWSGTRPWTLREAEVTNDGLVGGYAYGAGPSGGEGDSLTIVLLEANGTARLEELSKREGVSSCTSRPDPMVNGIFLDPDNDRMVVRFQTRLGILLDSGDWKLGEHWATYVLSSGIAGRRLRPRAALEMDERLGPISAARALPGTGLVLVHWGWYERDALGSVFTLHDAQGELRWRLDWRTEISGRDSSSPESALWQKLRQSGAILEVAAPGRFTLGDAAKLERATFEARRDEGTGTFEVREIARSLFEPRLQLGPTMLAPSGEPEHLLRPQHLGTIVLGEAPALPPIHDVIEFGVDGRGRLGVLCGNHLRREFVLVEADGAVLGTVELPGMPGGALFDMACVGGESWIVVTRPVTAGVGQSAWWVEPEAGRLVPIEGFNGTCSPELMSHDSGDPLPCRISGPHDPQDPSSWVQALAMTSDGRVAVLSHFPQRVQLFSRTGELERAIVLKEAWGREPRYPTGMRADLDGGVIVHDQGEPPIVRMDREGAVTAAFTPLFPDGNEFTLHGDVQVAPDGTLWTSDGYALLALDGTGVVQRVLGAERDAEALGKITALVVGPGDLLYAVDRRTGAVHVFDETGRRLHVCKPSAEDFADERVRRWLTVFASGEVFLSGDASKGLARFGANGERLGIGPATSADGLQKWYAQPGTGRMWVVGRSSVSLREADGRVLRSIERAPDGKWLHGLTDAAVARDGSLAVTSVETALGGRVVARLLVCSPEGEASRFLDLPPDFVTYRSFAFDGRKLACLLWDSAFTTSMGLVDLETGVVQRLALERSCVHWTPAFAADGSELWLFDGERRVERYRLD